MSLSLIAFLVLVAAFAVGSFTKINAGLLATVAAFGVGTIRDVHQGRHRSIPRRTVLHPGGRHPALRHCADQRHHRPAGLLG
ncbi:hypothetical protein ACFFGR_10850 [Arthrobacter liuii]|uniref:hypothetical protein n=1 Tax=Arthrobacter liuii TaxID=1476996 RepID=UPI00357161A4